MLEKVWVALETICRNKAVKDDSCEDSDLHTERMPHGDRDRGDCDAAVSQGIPGATSCKKQGKALPERIFGKSTAHLSCTSSLLNRIMKDRLLLSSGTQVVVLGYPALGNLCTWDSATVLKQC